MSLHRILTGPFLAVSLAANAHAHTARAQTAPAQTAPAAGRWTVEGGVAALGPPPIAASNITTRGTAPLTTLRIGRTFRARWAATATVAYGVAGAARRDVYERQTGPTRIDTYDYRALLALAGAEYAWPIGRAEGVVGAEAGWVKEGWRVATHVDPANLEPPRSYFDGNPAAAGRLGLRYPLGGRAAVSGAVRVVGGEGTLSGRGAWVLPELGVRWRF